MKIYLLEFYEIHESVCSLGVYSTLDKARKAADDYAKSHYTCHDIEWNNQFPQNWVSDGETVDRVYDQQIFFVIRKLTVDDNPIADYEHRRLTGNTG